MIAWWQENYTLAESSPTIRNSSFTPHSFSVFDCKKRIEGTLTADSVIPTHRCNLKSPEFKKLDAITKNMHSDNNKNNRDTEVDGE